ncbi:hypothetical protein RS85_03178 [Microbacterium sp. SA39]|nr:hypothetical protein RS85_03178 [Microbacterium sp. SA39]
MDQNPVPGQDALAPPDAAIAQRYLDEARMVATRRDRAVDRRALAWLQIANAAVTAVYLTAFAWVLESAGSLVPQVILFVFLVWIQIASGMAQRNGMQWRMTRSRWLWIAVCAVVLITSRVVFGFAVVDRSLPLFVMFLPGGLVLVALGGYGLLQLLNASRDPRPPRPARRRLPLGVRIGTMLLGAAFGVLILLLGAPDGVVASTILLLIFLLLLALMFASRSDLGLPAIGAAWRWPHVLVFAVTASALLMLVMVDAAGERPVGLGATALIGAGAVLLFVGAAFIPGRDARE